MNSVNLVAEYSKATQLLEILNCSKKTDRQYQLQLDTKYYSCSLDIQIVPKDMDYTTDIQAVIYLPDSLKLPNIIPTVEIGIVVDLEQEFPELQQKCWELQLEYVTERERIIEALEANIWPDMVLKKVDRQPIARYESNETLNLDPATDEIIEFEGYEFSNEAINNPFDADPMDGFSITIQKLSTIRQELNKPDCDRHALAYQAALILEQAMDNY